MKKLLAVGAAAVLGLLVLIWYQLHTPAEAAPAPAPQAEAARAPAPVARAQSTGLAQAAAKVAEETGKPEKVDPASDAFFYKFDDLQPHLLDKAAATCYTGGLHRVGRNAKLKLAFKDKIVNGDVTVTDVKIVDDTIHDKELTDCFVREVSNTKWHDDSLPDWTQDDELVIRPERGMKKYTKENMDYEGSGPDFTGKVIKAQ
jgi:nucleoid-associated protein YgaU